MIFQYSFYFVASKLGIKELVPPYLDPNLRNEDLPTGVSFASGGMGYDPETNKISVRNSLLHLSIFIAVC